MQMKRIPGILFVFLITASLAGCGGGSGDGDGGGSSQNRAQFTFDCDLSGANAELSMNVEAIGASGVVWGSGANPDISGVIGTGDVTYYTDGTMQSANASYVFSGENQFADFTDMVYGGTFLVEWVLTNTGLDILVNPYGPGTTMYSCVQTSSSYL
jgi:hypothetical protein